MRRLYISSAMLGLVLLAGGLTACAPQPVRKAGNTTASVCTNPSDVATIPALDLDNARFWRDSKKSFSIRAVSAASPWMTTCPVTLFISHANDADCNGSKKLFDANTQFLLYGTDRTIRFSTNAITGNPFEVKEVDLDSGIVSGQTRAYIRFHTPPGFKSPHTLFLYFLNAKNKDGTVPKFYLLEDFDDDVLACKKHMPDSGDVDHKLAPCDATSCPPFKGGELDSQFVGWGNVHTLQTDTGVGTEHKP